MYKMLAEACRTISKTEKTTSGRETKFSFPKKWTKCSKKFANQWNYTRQTIFQSLLSSSNFEQSRIMVKALLLFVSSAIIDSLESVKILKSLLHLLENIILK